MIEMTDERGLIDDILATGALNEADLARMLQELPERYEVEAALELPETAKALESQFETVASPELSDDDLRKSISDQSFELIVGFETGGQHYYERIIKARPHWPGGQSGVTIGCGFDLGHNSKDEFRSAWNGLLQKRDLSLLEGAVGKKGVSARHFLPRVLGINVPWGTALAVFENTTLLKYCGKVFRNLPNVERLHPHSVGALVSLVFNRGASFRLKGHRYREMRRILELMGSGDFGGVPEQIRQMKRLWENQGLEGLLVRRDQEAELFQKGLDVLRVASAGTEAISLDMAKFAGAEKPAELYESLENLSQDDIDEAVYEAEGESYEIVRPSELALEAVPRRYSTADVRWVSNDQNNPEYRHLPQESSKSTFQFTAQDLELLIKANRFDPHFGTHGKLLFGLRGARLVSGGHSQIDQNALTLEDTRPNHRDFRCVIGVYDRENKKLSGFTASTVPNAGAVVKCYNHYNFGTKKQGNMLPTGCYELCVGTHYGSATVTGVFRLGNGPMPANASEATVLRSGNDVIYGTKDLWDRCTPKDNVHPAFGTQSFSSLGCLTVRGSFRGGDRHTHEWGMLREAAGLRGSQDKLGTRFDIVLLTGLDAATAVGLRTKNATDDSSVDEALGCLRHGSRGDQVAALQRELSLNGDSSFGPKTKAELAKRQQNTLGWSTGLYSADMDMHLGMSIFGGAVA
jgi:hypothetical protein